MKLEKGTKAPFSGVLLTPAALAKVVTELEKKAERLRIELEAEKAAAKKKAEAAEAVFAAKLEAEKAKRAAVEGDLLRQREIYEKALTRASASPPWYKSRYLSFLAGAVISGGVCAGVSAARK